MNRRETKDVPEMHGEEESQRTKKRNKANDEHEVSQTRRPNAIKAIANKK